MTVVSSKEFAINEDKYFDLAMNEQVFLKKGDNMFVLTHSDIIQEDMVFQPDEDFHRSITIDELHRRVKENIHKWYRERNENYSITRS